jgi:DNA-binding GntR family transcriptional regulator
MSASATLAETIADALRADLRAGHIPPGERLIELALVQKYQVSQAAVRDALHLLEREGWVVSEARRGARVRSFTPESAHEVFALLAEIEGLALGWAARDHTRVTLLEALRPCLDHAHHAQRASQWAERRAALRDFHQHIAALAARPQTQTLLNTLHNQAELLTAHYERHGNPDAYRTAQLEGYEHVFGMIKFGDPEEAQAALRTRLHADAVPMVRWLAGGG